MSSTWKTRIWVPGAKVLLSDLWGPPKWVETGDFLDSGSSWWDFSQDIIVPIGGHVGLLSDAIDVFLICALNRRQGIISIFQCLFPVKF